MQQVALTEMPRSLSGKNRENHPMLYKININHLICQAKNQFSLKKSPIIAELPIYSGSSADDKTDHHLQNS